ncbi:MAG TPA: hypothetical protein VI750_11140, partial [Pyrinomonadaceae bacterium]|nr:hypothetical protein [Pyrinomonadaceae bacterium]
HKYDPKKGNVPKKGKFQCSCGQTDDIIASIRTLPHDKRLPVRPYAVQACLPPDPDNEQLDRQPSFFEDRNDKYGNHQHQSNNLESGKGLKAKGLFIPDNGKLFKRFTVSDMRRLQQAETIWMKYKEGLPYPRSAIPAGEKTRSGLLAHHYNHWHEMFAPRQLLALSTLMQGIMAEEAQTIKEMLLTAYYAMLNNNNVFARYQVFSYREGKVQGIFSRHDFQPKVDFGECNVWGLEDGHGSFATCFGRVVEGKAFAENPYDWRENSKKYSDPVVGRPEIYSRSSTAGTYLSPAEAVITDPPYVGNVNYAELADFFYVWLRLALKDSYPHFAPEYTPKLEEIVENSVRKKSRKDFFTDLATVFQRIYEQLPDNGVLAFTFHHTDQEGKVWEGLLEALCENGFEVIAVYPIHAESETSLHLMNKENISYDLIHVCRKRQDDPRSRSWAGVRQEVRRKAREELQAIERGRYGNQPLPEPDVRLICIGKCLELYSAHYGKVLDHENKPLPLHKALQDISAIVDQLVTKDRPLPSELEAVDGLSYVWLRILAPIRNEVMMDAISKTARGMQVSVDDLKDAGLVVRGRTGRGRTYEVKQPAQRLGELLAQYQPGLKLRVTQGELFTAEGQTIFYDIPLVDLVHLVIGLAQAGESVVPWLERFAGLRSQLGAALRYVRDIRADWKEATDRVLALIEGAPLLREMER